MKTLKIFLIFFAGLYSRPLCAQTTEKLIYDQVFAPNEGLVNRTEAAFRKEICLNGRWDIQTVALPKGYQMGKGEAPDLPLPRADAWSPTKIKIPSPWNVNAFANRELAGPDHRNFPSYPKAWEDARMAWMRKMVSIPADWNNKQIKLHFEAVAGFAEVYVDGEKVAENFDLFLPFEADITDRVQPGQTIEVLVGVRDQALYEDKSTIGRRIIPAGSMWGTSIRGIWQDVYLLAYPKIHIADVFVKPLVSQNTLELEISVKNNTSKKEVIGLNGVVNEWLNKAGTDVNTAPVPNWQLGREALSIADTKLHLSPNAVTKTTIRVPVSAGDLNFWTPDHPALYALRLNLHQGRQKTDTKYERFGWREWTFDGTRQLLNGKAIELKGDSWHFMGIPQMTRRYAWAWFTAIKGMNGNAVRPHAQVYPRFYLDMADEMGICVLNETANWASDGGPKLDAPEFWEASKKHLERFVLRDRNHPSVFGWSISNENKPVILHVFNKPDLMPQQQKAWEEWRDIVQEVDPTRPWISADGEDDGNGILPTTVGHYGDLNSMKRWLSIGKPWGIGEHSMAYYGTPEQVSKYNGERAYESQQGRMEGLANEVYHLIANQRQMGASYISIFNMAWYALKPLPIGKKELSRAPSLTDDGVFFPTYIEGQPGVQPERIGPYSSTFNPGYDPALPLYDPWPVYDALRAANAPGKAAWSPYKDVVKTKVIDTTYQAEKSYAEVVFVGGEGAVRQVLDAQGVEFVNEIRHADNALFIIDGSQALQEDERAYIKQQIAKGADVWIWGITPQTLPGLQPLLPLELVVKNRVISSFIPKSKSWFTGLNNSDFYFCEIQQADVASYGLAGDLVNQGDVLLEGCITDWRKWNKRPEEIKTAATVRSEYEGNAGLPVFVKYQQDNASFFVSTLVEFANSEKGYNTLATLLKQAGIPTKEIEKSTADVFFLRDGNLQFPESSKEKFSRDGEGHAVDFWVWSPRPLDDLLIEPNMPKLTLFVDAWESSLMINDIRYEAANVTNRNSTYKELPLLQGWNKVRLHIGNADKNRFKAHFSCTNKADFLPLLKVSFINPEVK